MPERPAQPNRPENVEREARTRAESTSSIFADTARRFDAQAWAKLIAPGEGGAARRLNTLDSRLRQIFEGWISALANRAADTIEERERVKENTWHDLQEMNRNSAESLMRLAEMQTRGEDPERTHARYIMLVEAYVEGLRNINPQDIVNTLHSRSPILTILGKLQNNDDPEHRLSAEDYSTITDFVDGLRTDRHASARTDPARLFDQSLVGALATSMSQDEFKTLCKTFYTQGGERRETGRFLLLFAVQRGYRPKEMAGSIARVTHLENADFLRLLDNAETSRQQIAATMENPEINSIMAPFFGNVVAHTMSYKKYVLDSTVAYLGVATVVVNVLGRIIEHVSEATGKPWDEKLMAVFQGAAAAAVDPYAWLGLAAVGYGAHALSDGRASASFMNAPRGDTRREQERVDKQARLWDEVHTRENFDTFIILNFSDLNSSAEEQKQANHISRPRREDIRDLDEKTLRAWGFNSQDVAKDSVAQAFQILRDDFPDRSESEQDLRLFFEELRNSPRPSRVDIPTSPTETA